MSKPQYGRAHRKARDKALDMMPNGAPCPRCNRPMYKWQRLQLGHVISVAMGGSNGPTRIEHGVCNESAGARLGNRLRRARRRTSKRMPSLGDRTNEGSEGMPSSGVPMPSDIGSDASSDRDSKPSVYKPSDIGSKASSDSDSNRMNGIGDMGSGVKRDSSPANRRLPKW